MKNRPERKTPNFSFSISPWYLVRQIGELGFIIALPLVGFVFLGHWLDLKMGLKACFVFLGIGAAVVLSSLTIYYKIAQIQAVSKAQPSLNRKVRDGKN